VSFLGGLQCGSAWSSEGSPQRLALGASWHVLDEKNLEKHGENRTSAEHSVEDEILGISMK
jgi:hypothetical protein